MSKSDTDSNSESYKSLSDDDNQMFSPKDEKDDDDDELTGSASEMESSDGTVDDATVSKVKTPTAENTSAKTLIEEADKKEKIQAKVENENVAANIVQNPAVLQAIDLLKGADDESKSDDLNNGGNANRIKYSRGEKKARRLLIKQGAKPLPNVSRLVMRQGMVLFIIENAEVYKNPRSDTYVVFGEVRVEDLAKQQENMLACSQIKAAQSIVAATKTTHDKIKPILSANFDEEAEDVVDETGIDPADINLVMTQASTTRARAVHALKKNNNDIVNAIMELTM